MQSKAYFQAGGASPENASWSKYFLLIFLFFLVACGGGGDSGSGGGSGSRSVEISGVVANGNALTNAPIFIRDQSGNEIKRCATNDKGKFRCSFSASETGKNLVLEAAGMIALIIKQQAQKIEQNINPLTDYVAREAAESDTTDYGKLGSVSKGKYEEKVADTFAKIGMKPNKFLTDPFEARVPGNPTSGSAPDDMLEALKRENDTLNKAAIDEIFTDEGASERAPLVTKRGIQGGLAIEATQRGATSENAKKELEQILAPEILNKSDILNNFAGTIDAFRKAKSDVQEGLQASNKGDLVKAILDLIEIALLKETRNSGANQNLKDLADEVVNLLQDRLINKINENLTFYEEPANLATVKEEIENEIEDAQTLTAGVIDNIIDQGVQEAEAELEKWKVLPLPRGVRFDGQKLENYPQMQNIAIDGDRALVGDPANNRLYSFRYENDAWVKQPDITCLASRNRVTGKFGYSVAIDGAAAIAGAPEREIPPGPLPSGGNAGATCTYTLQGGRWSAPSGGSGVDSPWIGSLYGLSVSIAGEDTFVTTYNNPNRTERTDVDGVVALVGAPGARIVENDAVSSIVGKLHTWIRTGITSWEGEDSEQGQPNSQFGSAVSTDGETAVIGAFNTQGTPSRRNSDHIRRGAVYFYKRTNAVLSTRPSRTPESGWTAQGSFTGETRPLNVHRLGYAVSVHGDTAIVSAANKWLRKEVILVFTRSGNTWSFQQEIDLENSVQYPVREFNLFKFRTSLAIHGDTFIVGIERPDSLHSPNFTQEVRIYRRDRSKANNKQWELESTFKNRGGRAVAYKGGKFLTSGEVYVYGDNSIRSTVWSYTP